MVANPTQWGMMEYSGGTVLLGQYDHTIDDKHRLTLPARFRAALGSPLVAAPGLDGCLVLYPRAAWDEFVGDQLQRLDQFSREGRLVVRHLFGRAVELEPDRQGRLQLPAHLVEHARLRRSAVIAGVRDHLEVWDAQLWARALKEAERSVGRITQELAEAHLHGA